LTFANYERAGKTAQVLEQLQDLCPTERQPVCVLLHNLSPTSAILAAPGALGSSTAPAAAASGDRKMRTGRCDPCL